MSVKAAEQLGDRFSRALSDALERSHLSNTEIADGIGARSSSVISHWKSGLRPVPARHAQKLAAILGVQPGEISAAFAEITEGGALPFEWAPPGYTCVERLASFGKENGPNAVALPDFVLDMKVGNTPMEDVRWVRQPTTAMAPSIPQGTLVLIDATKVSQQDVIDGELYAYELYGRPYVRRIMIGRDSWSLCGHDPSTERVKINSADLGDLTIRGAVLGWL